MLPIVLAAGYDVDDAAGHDPSGTGGGAKQRDCCKVLELGWWCFFLNLLKQPEISGFWA